MIRRILARLFHRHGCRECMAAGYQLAIDELPLASVTDFDGAHASWALAHEGLE